MEFNFKNRDAVARLWHVPGWYRLTSLMFNFMDGIDPEQGLDIFVPDDIDDEQLGLKVYEALAASRFIEFDDMPDETAAENRRLIKAWEKKFLDRTGVKKFRDLAEVISGTDINRDHNFMSFVNFEVHRNGEAFVESEDSEGYVEILIPRESSAERVGQAARKALASVNRL